MYAQEEREIAVLQDRSSAAGFGSCEIRGQQPPSPRSRRNYKFAMEHFIAGDCTEPLQFRGTSYGAR